MNYSKIQFAARWLVAGALLISAGASSGAEFWLRAGTTQKVMPGGAPTVNMWGFAQSLDSGVTYGDVTSPGPQLNATAGESLTIHLANTLSEPVSIIIPGQYGSTAAGQSTPHDAPAYAGRVRSLTLEAAPGGSQDFVWNNVQAGTFLYHSGSHPSVQVQMGLYGALTVLADATHAYAGVPFDSSVTLLFSEIDPEVHDAVAGGGFGPGPSFQTGELSAVAAGIAAGLIAHTDPVYLHLWSLLSPDAQSNLASATGPAVEGAVSAAVAELLGGSSIYNPAVMPDGNLSAAALALLQQAPEVNQPLSAVPYNGFMVRLNRVLLTDALAHLASPVTLPPVKTMSSTIRSYPQYFLVNGTPYDASANGGSGNNTFAAGAVGGRVLLRLLNAGMDAHVPTLQNGGDLQLVAEDGQKSPYIRNSYSVWLPALKTADAICVPQTLPGVDPCTASAEGQTIAVYDRRLGLVNGANPGGGMLAYLKLSVPAPTPVSTIAISPVDPSVQDGASVTLTAAITGGFSGIAYVWKKNGTVVGGSGPTLSFVAAYSDTPNPAVYTVTVTDCGTGGAEHTATTSVTVTPIPVQITQQPTPTAVVAGQPASFSVTATGTQPLHYQWQVGPSWTSVGTDAPTLTFASVAPTDAGSYRVVVTGPGVGNSQTSDSAALTVITVPVITAQPQPVTLDVGLGSQTANFTVTATSQVPPPLTTYQWYRGATALVDGPALLGSVTVSGATTDHLTIVMSPVATAATTYIGNYSVKVTNPAGTAISSAAALSFQFTLTGGGITIPFGGTTVATGDATPYPSVVPPTSQVPTSLQVLPISKVTLTLNGLTHPRPYDVRALLVRRTGLLSATLGGDALVLAGAGPTTGAGVSGLTVTFDDSNPSTPTVPATGFATPGPDLYKSTTIPTKTGSFPSAGARPTAPYPLSLATLSTATPAGLIGQPANLLSRYQLYVWDDSSTGVNNVGGGNIASWSVTVTMSP